MVPELSTWFLNLVLSKFLTDKEDPDHPASTHLSCTQGLLTRIGTLGYHPAWTGKAQGGAHYDLVHHPEDAR
jgi:hypothetical protein